MKIQTYDEAADELTVRRAAPPPSSDAPSSHAALNVEVRRFPRGAVVILRGTAGMVEAKLLLASLDQLAGEKPPLIILDLSQLVFIGSSALAALVRGYQNTREDQGRFRLAAPQPRVLDVLRRTALTKLFAIYPSVQEAMTA